MEDFKLLIDREQSVGDNPLLLRAGHKVCFTLHCQELETKNQYIKCFWMAEFF